MYYNLEIGKSYNFTLFSTGALGVGFANAKVLGIMDYSSAKIVQDITPLHIQAYPNLPEGTPRDASKLIYVKLKTTTDEIRVIAMDWISSQPVEVTTQAVKVTISQISSEDVANIRNLLIVNGYSNIEMEII